MEFEEIESKSSSDSWSTCDILSTPDLNVLRKAKKKTNLSKSTLKKIFSLVKTFSPSPNPQKELDSLINSIFSDQNPEFLCEKLSQRCCNLDTHNNSCIKKWKNTQTQLLALANEEKTPQKLIFSIKKRQNQAYKILLSDSQPHWIHKIFLQSRSFLGIN